MTGKVLVNLKESRHIAVIGAVGYGKTTYARKLVEQALVENPTLHVYVFGARDVKWKELSHMGLVTLFGMEDTIKGRLLDKKYPETDDDTLVVIDDLGHTLQMLPEDEQDGVVSRLHEWLTKENVYSIITNLRPIKGYYPKEILDLANTKVALNLENEADYVSFFDTKAFKTNETYPTKAGESFIDTKTTRDPVFIDTANEIELN